MPSQAANTIHFPCYKTKFIVINDHNFLERVAHMFQPHRAKEPNPEPLRLLGIRFVFTISLLLFRKNYSHIASFATFIRIWQYGP